MSGTPALRGQNTETLSAVELANKLFAPEKLPQVQLRRRFEFFSAYEEGELAPSSSADFVGEIDLASRKTHFEFKDYKSPVYKSKEPAIHTFYSVTFDGDKWLVLDRGSRVDALPKGVEAIGEITSDRPRLFLKSLDHLCFPLFASLLNVQVGLDKVMPLQEVLDGKAPGAEVTTKMDGGLLILTVSKGRVADELTFDTAKTFVLVHRRTDFGPKNIPSDNSIVNELTVSQYAQAGNLWFPATAEFTQNVNDKLMVKRDYYIEDASVRLDARPIKIVVPTKAYVRDEHTGEDHPAGSTHK